MKVLIVNTYESSGGAARAANRLFMGLNAYGVDCEMLVAHKESDNKKVNLLLLCAAPLLRCCSVLDSLLVRFYFKRTKTLFSPAIIPFSKLAKSINQLNPDIVHLHWITGGFTDSREIAKIRAPIVWSLHDMWPFTGGCHYDESCGRFNNNCGQCKVLGSSYEHDLSSYILKRKIKSFSTIRNLTIVGLSEWIARSAKMSAIFKNRHVVNLPNVIETDLFTVMNPELARKKLGLSLDKKIVLFGAMGATNDPRKGYSLLKLALESLQKNKNIELVVFGNESETMERKSNLELTYMGKVTDDESLKYLYNAADVVVVPSLQENLSNTIMESLSCGTPVVAFDIGGNRDMIDHKKNGYLVKPYDVHDLANGIIWVLNSEEDGTDYSRSKVLQNFSYAAVIPKYIKLYKKILNIS